MSIPATSTIPATVTLTAPPRKRRKRVRTGATAIQIALKATRRQATQDLKMARKLITRVNSGNRSLARGKDTTPTQWKIVRK